MEELKIKQKCEDMIVYAFTALRQYPRSEKYGLAGDTKTAMYELLRLIIICNTTRKPPYRNWIHSWI